MSKRFISFLMIALSISSFDYSMDTVSIIKKIFPYEGAHSIEVIENELIISKVRAYSKMVSLDAEEPIVKLAPVFIRDYNVVVDKKQKRILLSAINQNNLYMWIYDKTQEHYAWKSIHLTLKANNKKWEAAFDETKPTSILICNNNRVVSIDYVFIPECPNERLSEVFQDETLHCFRFGFNNDVGNYIVGQDTRGFKIFFDAPHSMDHQIKTYELPSGMCDEHYRCSSDMSFIVYYSDFGNPYTKKSYCCIFNLKTGKVFWLLHGDRYVMPCSIAIHPNDKVVAAMAAGNRNIHYWQASTGKLLSEHKASDEDMGEWVAENGCLNKWLCFPADGTSLFAVYPKRIIEHQVPIEVCWGMTKEELVDRWYCLRCFLPKELVRFIIGNF